MSFGNREWMEQWRDGAGDEIIRALRADGPLTVRELYAHPDLKWDECYPFGGEREALSMIRRLLVYPVGADSDGGRPARWSMRELSRWPVIQGDEVIEPIWATSRRVAIAIAQDKYGAKARVR